ncbi:PorT family protein [Dokdonia sinensis]|uniref:PorT family protein n=1 Tax=Dokdonia sinensis TaxID=2479847 RepID=A0A3M0GGR8_9FLAO|nr:porin family protein [Dokdonia sinensis]RMB63870.1 PorT family protein [Dokdonia sinensis]
MASLRFYKIYTYEEIFTLFVCCSYLAGAQIHFGPKAGVNFARLAGDDGESIKLRTSFHAGAFVEFEVSERFSLQPELYYSSQGAKQDFRFNQGDVSSTLEVTQQQDYLVEPLLAKFYATDRLFIEAGPQIGFLLKATGETSGVVEIEDEDIEDFTTNTDFALNLGVGYRFETNLFVYARFIAGLTNVNDAEAFANENPSINEDDIANQKNQVFQIGLGYRF